jgi:ABC-type lipoprotein export system ATPase subunit
MIEFFREMNRSEGITFIVVTHNTDLAKQAPRQFRMHRGAVQELQS